jgi:hypothetical protein
MSEAEFERRAAVEAAAAEVAAATLPISSAGAIAVLEPEPAPRMVATNSTARARVARAKPAKPKRVQRMFALEEDLDKKLWLYAIHVGKDRSEVINDLLRPLVASMVLYDSRDRRSARTVEVASEGQGGDEE